MKKSLFHRYPQEDWRFPVSRDYKLVVSCEMISCPINKSNYCSMPSSIKITSGGFCKTGRDLIDSITNKNIKEIDGD